MEQEFAEHAFNHFHRGRPSVGETTEGSSEDEGMVSHPMWVRKDVFDMESEGDEEEEAECGHDVVAPFWGEGEECGACGVAHTCMAQCARCGACYCSPCSPTRRPFIYFRKGDHALVHRTSGAWSLCTVTSTSPTDYVVTIHDTKQQKRVPIKVSHHYLRPAIPSDPFVGF